MIGTIRKNKPELPSALTNTSGRAIYSSLFAFTETHAIVSYLPKKNCCNLHLLEEDSSLAHGSVLQYGRRVGIQCICHMEGSKSQLEAGRQLQEEALSGGPRKSARVPLYTIEEAHSTHPSLSSTHEESAGMR